MTKSTSYCILICLFTIVVVFSISSPQVLSDKNKFLEGFVNHEVLNLLGVVVAITIASAAQFYLTLNSIAKRAEVPNSFSKTKSGVRAASYALIYLFVFEFVLVIVKPLVGDEEWIQSFVNGVSVIVVIWSVLILASMVHAFYKVDGV